MKWKLISYKREMKPSHPSFLAQIKSLDNEHANTLLSNAPTKTRILHHVYSCKVSTLSPWQPRMSNADSCSSSSSVGKSLLLLMRWVSFKTNDQIWMRDRNLKKTNISLSFHSIPHPFMKWCILKINIPTPQNVNFLEKFIKLLQNTRFCNVLVLNLTRKYINSVGKNSHCKSTAHSCIFHQIDCATGRV